jgi:diguanylate cyclase (GGDEF)-like protein/PAS domain S-box-containing protein
MILTLWPVYAGEITRAAAYSLTAIGVCRLFRRPMAASLGNARWYFVALLAAVAGLQFVMLAGSLTGRFALSRFCYLAAAGLLFVAALMLWPFLVFVDRRLSRRTAAKLHLRLRQARAQAAQSRRWLELGEQLSHVGHWAIEIPSFRLFWSDEIYRIHGLARDSFTPDTDSATSVFHPDDRSAVRTRVAHALAEKSGFEFEARLIRPDGQMRTVFSRGIVKLNPAGEVTRLFGVFMDLTEQKRIEAQLRESNQVSEGLNQALRQLALVDGLTGLPNRRHFDAAAETEFKRAIRQGSSLGVIMVDLDHFKGYNDLYGHPAGDACLFAVAQALAGGARRPGDFAARYGGEEFVLLLPNADAAGMKAAAQAILQGVAALGLPHRANPPGYATVSCGAALFEPNCDPHLRLALMQRADRALYEAKRNGRNCVVIAAGDVPDEKNATLRSAASG